MPRFASRQDEQTTLAIERWKILARDAVEEISSRRDVPGMDPTPEDHLRLRVVTVQLAGVLASGPPVLDPAPLWEVYQAAQTWHETRSANHVCPQPVLEAALQRAALLLNVVEAGIESRMLQDSEPSDRHTPTTPDCDPPVDADDLAILAYLAEQAPRTMTLVEIEAGANVSRKSVGRRIKRLASLTPSLVARPLGQRGGVIVTEDGKRLANKLARN